MTRSRLATIAGLVVVCIANVFLALLYLLSWMHYDGGDQATLTVMLALGWACVLVPLASCIYPGELKLEWRLLICCIPVIAGSWAMAAYG